MLYAMDAVRYNIKAASGEEKFTVRNMMEAEPFMVNTDDSAIFLPLDEEDRDFDTPKVWERHS